MAGDDLIRKVADELEIRNLIGKLSCASDEGTPEEYGALFVEDAVWRMGQIAGAPKQFPPIFGREAILAGVKERRAMGIGGPGSHTRHGVYQSVVEVDGDTAKARSYVGFFVELDKAPKAQLFAVYQDAFVRTPDGWKLSAREIEPS
jgi:hypothetical protein